MEGDRARVEGDRARVEGDRARYALAQILAERSWDSLASGARDVAIRYAVAGWRVAPTNAAHYRAPLARDLRGRGRRARLIMKVLIPTPLLSYTSSKEVEAKGATLGGLLADLDRQFPGLRFRVVDEQDRLRPHIRFFVNGEQTFALSRPLAPTDAIAIVRSTRGSDGRWTLQNRWRGKTYFELEKLGAPSRWIASSGPISSRLLSARCLTSTLPSASPLGPTMICQGMPMRSAVANFAPGR